MVRQGECAWKKAGKEIARARAREKREREGGRAEAAALLERLQAKKTPKQLLSMRKHHAEASPRYTQYNGVYGTGNVTAVLEGLPPPPWGV